MIKPMIYLLRTTNKGVVYYLNNISPNGQNVEFDRRIDHAWRFTGRARADLVRDHGHIRGTWVLLEREEKRIDRATHPADKGQTNE